MGKRGVTGDAARDGGLILLCISGPAKTCRSPLCTSITQNVGPRWSTTATVRDIRRITRDAGGGRISRARLRRNAKFNIFLMHHWAHSPLWCERSDLRPYTMANPNRVSFWKARRNLGGFCPLATGQLVNGTETNLATSRYGIDQLPTSWRI